MLFKDLSHFIHNKRLGLAADNKSTRQGASYSKRLGAAGVQVVVDASKHVPTGVDVRVQMMLGADGQILACNLQHFEGEPQPASSSAAPSPQAPPARLLSSRLLDLGHINIEAARRIHPKPALPVLSLDDFVPHKVLGAGGQGSVLAVEHKATGKMCALKTISKHTLTPSGVKMVLTEQATMKETAGCPFFPRLLASFETDSEFCIVSDLCAGGSLREKLSREGCLEPFDAKRIVAQLVLAVEELHKRRIIHRDIKPDNILLTEEGDVVLADFGICRPFGRDTEEHPWTVLDKEKNRPGLHHILGDKGDNNDAPDMTERCCGTRVYSALEVWMKKQYTFSVDIFSLGAVLYEALHGKLPYGVDYRERDMEVILEQMTTQPIFVGDHVDSSMHQLIYMMLDKDPSRRPTLEQIKRHPAMSGIDWKKLASRRFPKPIFASAAQSKPTEDIKNIPQGAPYREGQEPHFWFQYTSPSLHSAAKNPLVQSLRKKTAKWHKATPNPATRAPPPTPSPVFNELAAAFANPPPPSWSPFAPYPQPYRGTIANRRTASATLVPSPGSGTGTSATAVARSSAAPSAAPSATPSGSTTLHPSSSTRPSTSNPTPKCAASYTALQPHPTISSTTQRPSVVSVVPSPGGRTLVDPGGAGLSKDGWGRLDVVLVERPRPPAWARSRRR